MKLGGLCRKSTSVLVLILSYFLICPFLFIEVRDFKAEVIRRGQIGLLIPSLESNPKEDTVHSGKVGAFKLFQRDDINMQKLTTPPEKVDVDIIDRSLKENV